MITIVLCDPRKEAETTDVELMALVVHFPSRLDE